MLPKQSTHSSFSEFLDCVRSCSAIEGERLKGELFFPARDLDFADVKEPLRHVWDDHFAGLWESQKAVQEHLAEHLKNKSRETMIEIIAKAVWSCMLEHSDDLDSSYARGKSSALELRPPKAVDWNKLPMVLPITRAAMILGTNRETIKNWIENPQHPLQGTSDNKKVLTDSLRQYLGQ